MSGIATGTRLDQLKALRRRLDHEIAIEARRSLDAPTARRSKPRTRTYRERLEARGIEARQVKEWAVANGLLPEVKRGRVSLDLIEAYWEAQA